MANFNPANHQTSQSPRFLGDGSLDPTSPGFTTPAGSTQPFYTNGISAAGTGIPKGLVQNYFNTFQPRVGLSYDAVIPDVAHRY